ncbi:hypothetical protein SDC9_135383 [bioreactor metagenome]|uniref:Uncharacterized protein n=1 Tax=bioreactor metagenome TaxID=1076179 RepID=A0A645DGA4_9ZZZZ
MGAGAEVVGEQIIAVGGGADFVHPGHDERMPQKGGGHRKLGLSDKHRAVRPKAHSVEVGGGGAEHPVGNHQPQRRAGGHHIIVPVEAAHHPFPVCLQAFGHGAEGLLGEDFIPVGHHGGDACVGRIGEIALGAKVGICTAPEDSGIELRALGKREADASDVVSEGH